MPISNQEFTLEKKRLSETIKVIRSKISALGAELYEDQEKVLEFKKFLWDAHTEMDPTEMKTMMSNNDVEISIMMNRGTYLQNCIAFKINLILVVLFLKTKKTEYKIFILELLTLKII